MHFKNFISFLLSLILCFSFNAAAYAQLGRIVCDETCETETHNAQTAGKPHTASFSVVSPMPRSSVESISQAPRLDTFSGKTIAVVGVSFMTHITHPEIKRLILQHYPDAKVILLDEIGTAGVYPAPGITRQAKDDFQLRLKQMGVDAVIAGNGGCGLCTPKETGSCIAAEYIGIPSVIIAAPSLIRQARYTALNNGVPVMRTAEYPGAFALHDEQTLVRNIREVVWPQIVDALTRPITTEEIAQNEQADRGDIRDDVYFGSIDEVNTYFMQMNWSDGLPIVPPTFEKVTGFLQYTPYAWNETVAVLPPTHRDVKAWHVAVNAVMAGCKPEYMPILIAMTKALGGGDFRRTLASTHAWIPFCWVNGPIARQLGIDCGQGQINSSANVALGRFMSLALMNLCGYYVKQDRMGTFGYPLSWCIAEDEAACLRVGWQPFHVQSGYSLNDNTITTASTLLWGNNMAPSTTDPERMAELLAWDISERCQFALGSGKQFTFRTILMTEPVAQTLAKDFPTLESLENKLIKLSRRPLKERTFANYYANPGGAKDNGVHSINQYATHLRKTEEAQFTATPSWYDSPETSMLTIPTMKKGMTVFLVTGDADRNKLQTMPGGGYSTVRIELPNNWNGLMQELGYLPLESFFLEK